MRTTVAVSLLCALAPGLLPADEPPAKALEHDLCQTPDNQVMGPRSDDRPLPLLAGDAEHGFHPACAVSWATLSPMGRPLQVLACFRGSLLQLANDSACGTATGHLWVSSRWVHTSADAELTQRAAATCQHLDTSALAATRDYPLKCVPQKKDQQPPKPADAPAAAAPAPSPH
jgi:hypothetical protein